MQIDSWTARSVRRPGYGSGIANVFRLPLGPGISQPWTHRVAALISGVALISVSTVPTQLLACEAMTGGEYSEPPEFVSFDLPSSSWHTAFRGVGASYARKELLPPGETLSDWTQLVSWHVTFGRNRFDLPRARDAFLSSLEQQCPSLGTRQIADGATDLVYEWWHDQCRDRPPQHQIMRLVAGATGTHTIAYGRKGRRLTGDQRAEWVEWISSVELKRRVRMEGDLSKFEQARLAVWNGEYSAAVEQLTPMAESGSAEARELLGRLYFEGWGVEQSYAKAREWLEKALAQEYPRAAQSLGRLYDAGLGVPADASRALDLYKRAAEAGIGDAQGRVGYLLVNGPDPVRDPEQAYPWFERALENGHDHARFWLGRLAEEGTGTEKDLDRAVALYEQAARDGDPDAQHRLGVLYATGQGVSKNVDRAKTWLVRAAMQGNEAARDFYAKTFNASGATP